MSRRPTQEIDEGLWPTNSKFAGTEQEITLSIDMKNGRPPGDYTLAVLGPPQVPDDKNAAAKDRSNTLVSLPRRPITLRVLALEKK